MRIVWRVCGRYWQRRAARHWARALVCDQAAFKRHVAAAQDADARAEKFFQRIKGARA